MEEFRVGFILRCKSFLARCDEFSLILDTSLECLKDVCLDVVAVELRLSLLVLSEHGAHFLLYALFLLLELADNEIVLFFLFIVFDLHFGHALPDRPHLLDVWGQLGLLVLHLFLDLGD